jgi:hypothetical protein
VQTFCDFILPETCEKLNMELNCKTCVLECGDIVDQTAISSMYQQSTICNPSIHPPVHQDALPKIIRYRCVFCTKFQSYKKRKLVNMHVMQKDTIDTMKFYSDIKNDDLSDKIDFDVENTTIVKFHLACYKKYKIEVEIDTNISEKECNKIRKIHSIVFSSVISEIEQTVIILEQFLYLDKLVAVYKEKLLENELEIPKYVGCYYLKTKIEKKLQKKVGFTIVNEKTIVHKMNINPYDEYTFEDPPQMSEQTLYR